jgi:Zn-dependent protease
MINTFLSNPFLAVIYLAILVLVISIHEFSHALAANYFGDPTAKLSGRLTLNPTAHIDLYGMLFLIFAGFGWGKPVPVDSFNLKNPKKDLAIISLSGPASNMIMVLLSSVLIKVLVYLQLPIISTIGIGFLDIFIQLNLILAIFNFIPIYPLDGFKIVAGLLPEETAREWYSLERYGMIFLILLLIPLGGKSMIDMFLNPVISYLYNFFI